VGLGGYTTGDLERCNLSARAVALIYHWWSGYVRLTHPKARLEAITSHPLLLAGVARLTQHAGPCRLLVTLTHAASDRIKTLIANVRQGLRFVSASAPSVAQGRTVDRPRALHHHAIPRQQTQKSPLPRPLSANQDGYG
jgi:hypothetical protein